MKLIGKLKTKSASEIGHTRVGVGFEGLDRELYRPECCYDLAAATGAQLVRTQSGWIRCETERGVYSFDWLDEIVDSLISRGMKPWFNVGYGHPMYMKDIKSTAAVGCVPFYFGDEALDAWKSYVKAMAEHFRGRVTHFEIWNEPDLGAFWYPKRPDPVKYAELISLTGSIIRSVIPDAKIGGCCSQSRPEYLYALFSALKPEEIDFFCPHNYDRYPERSVRTQRIRLLRLMLDELGFDNTVLWMGECGHASWHPVGHSQCREGGGNEHRQAVWHLRRYFLDLAEGYEMTSIYVVADNWERTYQTATFTEKKPAAQGILNGLTYTPKKSHEVMGYAAVALSGDCRLSGPVALVDSRESDEEAVTVSYTRNGHPVMAYWLGTAVEREEQSESCSLIRSPLVKLSDPVLIDTYTGEVYEPDPALTSLPLREYPILLTERDCFEIIPNT